MHANSITADNFLPGWVWFPNSIPAVEKPSWEASPSTGDGYLRKLLIQGARAVLFKSDNQEDSRSQWINKLRQRKPDNVVATALAAKIARTAWAIMISGQTYQEGRLMQ